ncbi:Glucan endo-1,3-beta-glucosidase 1 [Acorus gramineus]|uniref:Glucan endo-1,3-beta-glucosidase 1 n=1 Tax=Acorus gramineus TaxID=55184 RepID=A0AAV9BN57_ACOGR|nr:Glucan endo-1,3-beta-glucosidase 1 [Acorus gramineus]
MAKTVSLCLLCFALLLSTGWTAVLVNGQTKTWCVAKASSNDTILQENLRFACSNVDCSIINTGKPCFEPNILISHVSVIMNLYYRAKGSNVWNCDFGSSGLISITDPSYGTCAYA